jgi:DNA-directed RNA polymerase subunit M/transcription elongation factor TFIIS
MSLRCPNCGYVDENHDREQGYRLENEDTGQSNSGTWRNDQGFETVLSTPQRQSVRCPECGERI